MATNIRKEGTGGSSSLTGKGMTYTKVINPFKAVCEVKIRKGVYRTEGFACTVLVKRGKTEVAHFVTLSVVASDFNKPTQIYRFSRLHSGQYWLTVDSTTVQTFGPFSFLQVGPNMNSRAASSSGKDDWEVICLAFQAPGVNTSSLEAYSFVGSERLKLKLKFQGDTKTYKLEASKKDMQKLSRAVVGAPIIVENKQIVASNSGRWSVVGVLGLSEEGEFCPYFVSSEILGQLENTPNPSGKLEVDAPGGLHQVLPTAIQEVNDQLTNSDLSPVSPGLPASSSSSAGLVNFVVTSSSASGLSFNCFNRQRNSPAPQLWTPK
ncbi:uncharacterized protein [Montipora foliosa]|uniref:uncharacterized protein n=1 Tax=Montipora foliosa TaxID=591990 RepID=UPI0035F1E328